MALVTMALALLGMTTGSASAATSSTVTISPTPVVVREGSQVDVTLTRTAANPTTAAGTANVTFTVPSQSSLTISGEACDFDSDGNLRVVEFAALGAHDPPQHCVVQFVANDNHVVDGNRTMTIGLSTNASTSIATTLAATVQDDDMAFSMVSPSLTATEGQDIAVPVRRTGITPEYEVESTCACPWAQSGPSVHYRAEFEDGEVTHPIEIPGAWTEDEIYQPDRHATFTIVDGWAAPDHLTTDVLIRDNDSLVRMGAMTVDAARSDGVARIPVVREGNRSAGVTIPYTVTPVTAQEGRDYEHTSGTLTIPANTPAIDLTVPLKTGGPTSALTFKVAFGAGFVANDGGAHAGSTILKDALSTTVTIAAIPETPEQPRPPEKPKDPDTPKDLAPELTAQLKLRTKGGEEYVALPKAKTKGYLAVKLKADKAIAAGTKIRLTGNGLTFGAGKSTETIITVASLIPANGAFHTVGKALAVRTTSKTLVKVTPAAVDDAVKVAGTALALSAPTHTITLKVPAPVSRSKDHAKDLVTWFTGTYSAATCSSKPAVFYYVKGSWYDAQVPLKPSTVAGICQFTGKIRWEPGILNYAHIKVRIKLGKRTSKPITLKVKRNR